jgi:hypothetical protein
MKKPSTWKYIFGFIAFVFLVSYTVTKGLSWNA